MIKCEICGANIKKHQLKMKKTYTEAYGVKYGEYDAICPKCGGTFVCEECVKRSEESMKKALARYEQKTGINPIEFGKYSVVARKVCRRAREIASEYKENPSPSWNDINKAYKELSEKEKQIMLDFEDKKNMEMLTAKPTTKHPMASARSVLLLTQGIIESAIEENDEDFFKGKYGEYIVEAYTIALKVCTNQDYDITASFLLDKMRKGEINIGKETVV